MIVEDDVYLEHFGVRGMKWGVRKASTGNSDAKTISDVEDFLKKNPSGREPANSNGKASSRESRKLNKEVKKMKKFEKGELTGKQKVVVGVAAYGAYSVGTAAAMKMLGEPSISKLTVAMATGVVAGVKGGQATANLLRKHNQTRLSEIKQNS